MFFDCKLIVARKRTKLVAKPCKRPKNMVRPQMIKSNKPDVNAQKKARIDAKYAKYRGGMKLADFNIINHGTCE